MKILLINTVPTKKNGITNVIFNLLTNIPKDGVEFGYVSISEPDELFAKLIKDYNARLYVIPRNISSSLRYIIQLSKIAKNYDIIHVHGNSATMVLEMLAAKVAGVKIRIAHSHNTTCSMKLIDKLMRPLFYHLCNGRIACGMEAGKWLFGLRDFKVLNNGIDTNRFKFNSRNREIIRKDLDCEKSIIIGHIGNFVEQKNHDFLIDIFQEISKSITNAKLLLLGGGILLDRIKAKVHNLKLDDKVIFAGSVENPEEYMSAMDLIIMPSLFEGLPLTLVEEQANGLQCVVADTITREADMTGNVTFISLKAPISEWVSNISYMVREEDRKRIERSDGAIEKIQENGYDIQQIAMNLKNYYIKSLNETVKD